MSTPDNGSNREAVVTAEIARAIRCLRWAYAASVDPNEQRWLATIARLAQKVLDRRMNQP